MDHLIKVKVKPKSIDSYAKFSPEVVKEIKKKAKKLRGLKVTHINATAIGGGVAEMLQSDIPLQQDLGLDSNWYIIPPNLDFFEVTKKIHNLLQGQEGELSKEERNIYLEYNKYVGSLLSKVKTDVLIIHDPQPAASISFLEQKPTVTIWRSHIDTSSPNLSTWNFMLPYLKNYDHYIFTLKDYAGGDFSLDNISFITPVIDPLSPKNTPLSKIQAKELLQNLDIDINKPLITQVSRLDPWKDPQGVIDAFEIAKKEVPDLQLALVAQMASDDPEGLIIYEEIKKSVKDKKDIYLLINLKNNDLAINAFQTYSDIILQKSIKEGFGLTVTEAMWKNAAVIGGNIGGIKLQIKNGVNGYLVSSIKETAEQIIYLLKNPKVKKDISRQAHFTVLDNFLVTNKLLKYLNLFQKLNNPSKETILRKDLYSPVQDL